MSLSTVLAGLAIGAGATLVMDVWNALLKRALGVSSLDFCLLGRWIRHVPEGTFRHTNIRDSARRPRECAVGWAAHYTIGVVLAVGFVSVVSGDWLASPTLLPALTYGLVTVVFPFFVLQPSLGLGIAGSRTPSPVRARVKSLTTHLVFGFGLYLAALSLGPALEALG